MGKKEEYHIARQKWSYINLDDFKSSGFLTPFSYGFLWVLMVISIACYIVDIFTAINLLAYDQWNGLIQPVIPLRISRWIFAGCIILSWVLLVYRWIKAYRALVSGSIAKCYLDPLAARVQSIRMDKGGRGWKRFVVFAALTKGKKGSEYVALFTYFSFEAWLRIVFAEGPRNVINALTLWSVMQSDLIPTGTHAAQAGHSPIVQFFTNIGILASSDHLKAAVLFGMLFTLVIWAFAAISLAIAALLYVMFLWHHIPSQDGGLRGFCKRKIDRSLLKIIEHMYKKRIEKEEKRVAKEEEKQARLNDPKRAGKKGFDVETSEFKNGAPPLSRTTTSTSMATTQVNDISNVPALPLPTRPPTSGSSRSGSDRPGLPSRMDTFNSSSFSVNAPLLNNAAQPGQTRGPPGLSRLNTNTTQNGSEDWTPASAGSMAPANGYFPPMPQQQQQLQSMGPQNPRSQMYPPQSQNQSFRDAGRLESQGMGHGGPTYSPNGPVRNDNFGGYGYNDNSGMPPRYGPGAAPRPYTPTGGPIQPTQGTQYRPYGPNGQPSPPPQGPQGPQSRPFTPVNAPYRGPTPPGPSNMNAPQAPPQNTIYPTNSGIPLTQPAPAPAPYQSLDPNYKQPIRNMTMPINLPSQSQTSFRPQTPAQGPPGTQNQSYELTERQSSRPPNFTHTQSNSTNSFASVPSGGVRNFSAPMRSMTAPVNSTNVIQQPPRPQFAMASRPESFSRGESTYGDSIYDAYNYADVAGAGGEGHGFDFGPASRSRSGSRSVGERW